jgi:hypothetical protein
MSFPDTFSYHFYPVGQGLFSAGSISGHAERKSRFLWVYDCGSLSSQSLIDNGIRDLKKLARERNRIDLLILSHFDHDHISGIVRLVNEFKIGTLMLPYMPLAQRLIIAFEEGSGGVDDPLTNFYVNPVAFLLALEGPGIESILFVPPSGNEGPTYPGELRNPREPGPEDEPKIDFDSSMPKDADDAESLTQAGQHGAKHAAVDFLQPGSRITSPPCLWEFIPYNDDPQEVITEAFGKAVEAECDILLSAKDAKTRGDSLRKLEKVYDDHFGAGSEERNVISLFLYSGPIYSSWSTCLLTEVSSHSWPRARYWHRWPFPESHPLYSQEPPKELLRPRCSILYSGDGYLDTNDRLQKLIEYLDDRRVQWTGVFQVMHHGAETNWHQGVAEAIAPLFSVFSSDPERKKWKHPHAQVLRDFWRYGSVQVDTKVDFAVLGYLKR